MQHWEKKHTPEKDIPTDVQDITISISAKSSLTLVLQVLTKELGELKFQPEHGVSQRIMSEQFTKLWIEYD